MKLSPQLSRSHARVTNRDGRLLVRLLVVTILGAFALEGAVRVRQYLKHGTTDRTIYARMVDEETGLELPSPESVVGGISINKAGFRGPELDSPKPEGRIRIGFLGGSTTFCAEVTDNASTWPHLVTDALREASGGKEIDYVNGGAPGFSSKHSITNLEARVAPQDPDVLVIYHCTNDLNLDTIEAAEERGIFSGKAEDPSWLGRMSMAWFLVEKNQRVKARQSREGQELLDVRADELSHQFAARLDTLLTKAKETADVVAICTFQTKARRDQTPEVQLASFNTSLYYMPYMSVETLLDGFDEYNRVIREAAERNGVLLIDTDGWIPGDSEHFVDSVHMSDAGAERMAACVSEALLSSSEMAALLD